MHSNLKGGVLLLVFALRKVSVLASHDLIDESFDASGMASCSTLERYGQLGITEEAGPPYKSLEAEPGSCSFLLVISSSHRLRGFTGLASIIPEGSREVTGRLFSTGT